MFTGLVEAIGQVIDLASVGSGVRFGVQSNVVFADAHVGDSIAINGCCLTIVAISGGRAEFEAGAETIRRTNVGDFSRGAPVNLERSLRAGDRLGGHYVTGHIDCLGHVQSRDDDGEWSTIWFTIPTPWSRQVVSKGSVAINGVSLTVVDVRDDALSVALIPHTLAETNLGTCGVGDAVNIETDVLAKYVEQAVLHYLPQSR